MLTTTAPYLPSGRVVVEAVEEDLVDGRADLPGGGLDEAEAQVARRVLDSVEVAGEAAVGRRDHDGARVGELVAVLVVAEAESGGLRQRASIAAASPVRKCQPPAALGRL